MKPIRFTELDPETSGARDFILRERAPTLPQLLLIFAVALAASIGITAFFASKPAMIAMLMLLFGVIGFYVMMLIQRSRDLVLATEFQNTMFASALGMNNKFCLITKQDGNIIYMDQPFQEMFPDFLKERNRTITTLVAHGKVGGEDAKKIFASIENGVYDKVIFDVYGSNGQPWRIVMSIEPILRPSGFILLRGREFVEQRNAAKSSVQTPQSPLLSKSNITLFAYVMDTMNIGVYITDPAGNLVYANPILEQWLSYQEGEINSGNFSLKDIVHHDGKRAGAIEPDNFEGEVTLQKKAGGLVKSYANQKIIRSEQGKTLGCVALMQYVAKTDADAKKKLW